jgi:hypothetical protein
MLTRTTSETVTFVRPFLLPGMDRPLPAGPYEVETTEQALEGFHTRSYRRTAVHLSVPAIAGVCESELWAITPAQLDAALALDRQPASHPQQESLDAIVPSSAELTVMRAKPERNASRESRGNAPFYGTLLGVLALLLASALLRPLDPDHTPSRTAQEQQ